MTSRRHVVRMPASIVGIAAPCAILVSVPSSASPTCPPDIDNNGLLEPADIAAFVQIWTNSLSQGTLAGDYDHSGVVDPSDISVFVADWLNLLNAGGCPPPITLSVSPTSGTLGTPITLTISPATAPNIFDAATTASWTGRYVPMIGSPTANFTLTFSAAEVRETSASQAVILLGSGSGSLPSGIENLGPGVFDGTLTVSLTGGASPSQTTTIAPETTAASWKHVIYPDGPGGLGTPTIGGEATSLPIMLLSITHPNPQHPTASTLMGASAFHLAVIVRISENLASTATAPDTLIVDVITYDASGTEVDRKRGLTLNKLIPDGDSSNIVYINDLSKPLVIVDVSISPSEYPGFVPLRGTADGSAAVVPGT